MKVLKIGRVVGNLKWQTGEGELWDAEYMKNFGASKTEIERKVRAFLGPIDPLTHNKHFLRDLLHEWLPSVLEEEEPPSNLKFLRVYGEHGDDVLLDYARMVGTDYSKTTTPLMAGRVVADVVPRHGCGSIDNLVKSLVAKKHKAFKDKVDELTRNFEKEEIAYRHAVVYHPIMKKLVYLSGNLPQGKEAHDSAIVGSLDTPVALVRLRVMGRESGAIATEVSKIGVPGVATPIALQFDMVRGSRPAVLPGVASDAQLRAELGRMHGSMPNLSVMTRPEMIDELTKHNRTVRLDPDLLNADALRALLQSRGRAGLSDKSAPINSSPKQNLCTKMRMTGTALRGCFQLWLITTEPVSKIFLLRGVRGSMCPW
jgi:hypothetical protein